MKSRHLLLLTFALSFLFLPLAQADFKDVPVGHPNYEAISALEDLKVVQGFPDGKFKPEEKVDRSQFLKMAYLAEAKRNLQRKGSWEKPEIFPFGKESTIKINPPCFGDLKGAQWFEPYVCWGKQHGLVTGDGNDELFHPLRHVNFAEASKIVVETSGYPYVRKGEHWAEGYIEVLGMGMIPSSIQTADQLLTRADAAQLIYNYTLVDYNKLWSQPTHTLIWDEKTYLTFDYLGSAGLYEYLKKEGVIYYRHVYDPAVYTRLENVDLSSFQVYAYSQKYVNQLMELDSISIGVATDAFGVFGPFAKRIEGSVGGAFQFFDRSFQAIPETLMGYGRDDKHAYLINCYEGCWVEILPNSNADEFEVMGNGYSRSGKQYYYLSRPIELSVNPDDLEFLTPVLGKQENKVYYFQPDLGEGWHIRTFVYLGKINLYAPNGSNRDMDYDEYYMSDGESIFMLKSGIFQKIDGADAKAFRLVNWKENNLFAMDGRAIYLSGSAVAESKLASFEVLGGPFELYRSTKVGYYLSDGEVVYLASCWQWNQCEMTQVPVGPNGKSFKFLGEGYGMDESQAYYAAQVLDVDLDTLTYLGKGYLKDKDHVYYPSYFSRDEVAIEITGADAQSFELNLANNEDLFCTFPMAKDGENLYLASRVMKNIDIDKEGGSLFFGSSYVDDIDYDSFELLDENGFFFKDANGFYRTGFSEDACISGSWEKLDKVEADSFKAFAPHYYSSQGQIYFVEKYYEYPLSQVDEATFEPLVKTFNNSVDLKHSYVAKDANFAYYKEDVIPLDIDVASFEYDHEKQVLRDKNRQYTLDEIETVLKECAYDYAPACGQLKEGEQSFRNSCLAKKAGSTTITDGLCTDQESTWEQACLAQRGTWIPESNYCRAYDSSFEEQTCTEIGGKSYNDCGSGCDPYSDSDICPSVCIPVCFF